ncbi:MAG: hypothetical protein ACLFVP_09865, partial [Candidatus Bathyarchaeia archaeon]
MSVNLKIDLSAKDLGMVFKDYEILALETLWQNPEHMFSSLEVTEAVNEKLAARGDSISRASIINFLQDIAEQGILERDTTTGKGGHRGIYQSNYTKKELRKFIIRAVLKKLKADFPTETNTVV